VGAASQSSVAAPRRPETDGVTAFADELFDELLPPSLDWRHLVARYPRAAVTVAAAAGFWLARRKSGLVMAAITSYVAAQFGDAVVDLGDSRRD
jgi:hypothetical protein